ncbi:hypothetical protein ACOME3_001744 [Neoechinorhynchus agilis]
MSTTDDAAAARMESLGGLESPMMVDDPAMEQNRVSALDVERVRERFAQIEREVRTADTSSNVGVEESSQGTSGPIREMESVPQYPTQAEKEEADRRSIYVGNVDYSTTADELEDFFKDCGSITRVTIMCDRFSGTPKGYAYVEFAQVESVTSAIALTDSLFKERNLKIFQKRTNMPGRSSGRSRRRFGGGSRFATYFRGGRFPRRSRWAFYYPY